MTCLWRQSNKFPWCYTNDRWGWNLSHHRSPSFTEDHTHMYCPIKNLAIFHSESNENLASKHLAHTSQSHGGCLYLSRRLLTDSCWQIVRYKSRWRGQWRSVYLSEICGEYHFKDFPQSKRTFVSIGWDYIRKGSSLWCVYYLWLLWTLVSG